MRRGRPTLNAPPEDSDLPYLVALWERASASPLGIVISSKRPNKLTQRLYAARRVTGSYRDLRVVEDNDKVWIVPK